MLQLTHLFLLCIFINYSVGYLFRSPFRLAQLTPSNAKCRLSGGLNPWEFYASSGAFFETAIVRFDHANSQDPNLEVDETGASRPRELLYAERLYKQVLKLNPSPSEPLLLASRSQHIMRWKSPRESYPMTKPGYLQWRASLKQFHANTAAGILTEVGYDETFIDSVRDLILKKNYPNNPDSRTLEDALCLVFLEFQLDEFRKKTEDAKTINALKKSWGKMTEQGRAEALKIAFSDRAGSLVKQALGA